MRIMGTVQWFPGHMAKTKRLIQEQLKLVDAVIEIVDARLPLSSRNPLLDSLIADRKPRVIILNKEDLADPARTKEWINYFNSTAGCRAIACNSTVNKKQVIATLKEVLMDLTKEKRERQEKKGIKKFTIRCMIVGIPNVGKSTFINIISGKKAAMTGDRPGVTRGTQWVRLDDMLELLDTPGILWPKFDDQDAAMKLAAVGSINDEVYDRDEAVWKLIGYLQQEYPALLKERFKLEDEALEMQPHELMDQIGKNRGCLLKGGRIDYSKLSTMMLQEFRSGKIGRITLERCP